MGPHICFVPKPIFFHYCDSIIELEVRDGDASGSLFIVHDWAILDFLFFHMKFSIVLSRSVNNCTGILKVIALNL